MAAGHNELFVDFRANKGGEAFRATGWSTAEPDETWTVGPESRLTLPSPNRPATYVMTLRMRPMVAPPSLPAQRLRVSVNDVEVGNFVIAERAIRTCLIPWPVIAGRPELRIRFHLPDAARPFDKGLNSDRRELGVAFTALELYPDRHDPRQDDALAADGATFASVDQMPLHDLMLTFESLGQNCEFGLVQRQCLAEPLGLLRFSSAPLPLLLDALDKHFEGMGALDTISVSLAANGHEYMVHDQRFGFLYHAWVNADEMAAADVARREARRVPFLVRKLLEDLAAGEKIFVFKGMGFMPEQEVFPLAMALRRHGPNTLLFVNLSDAAHRGGTVEARGPGFMVGYLDRFAPGDNAHDLLLDQWVALCREAYRLRRAVGSGIA